jgi:beta-galactosidase/beta-glucuronidase
MERLFRTHYTRKKIEINPIWDFCTVDNNGNKGETIKMVVPSCWESHPNLASYRGKALYSQKFSFGGNIRLVFKGVSHTANIYLDGKFIKYHYNAYTEFDVILKNIDYSEHLLEVQVDNSFHKESSLHVPNDYYSYGGITRPVVVEQLGDTYIKQLHFTPSKTDNVWNAHIKTTIVNLSEKAKTLKVDIQIDEDNAIHFDEVTLAANSENVFEKALEIFTAEEYSIESPQLYYLKAIAYENGQPVDDLIDRVGFRSIKIQGKDILLNGKKLHLKGFNRHEDYAEFGCALPLQAMQRDIEILKDLGSNCVRTSHYPNDERFLDLCDEYGILVWEEAHARGLSEEQMRHKNFDKQSADCISEMIENHYNHPSIFTWGILNECASYTDYGRGCYEKQYSLMRELDESRPLTSASCHFGKDKCLDLLDIVSFNIYPGWYFDEPATEHLKRLKEWIASTEGKDKPLIISETGAGAVYGFRSTNKAKWTEDLQEEILEEQVTSVLENKDCSGVFIWQFADCRVSNENFYARPKSQNNKGVVDIYRRQKLAYKKVKEIFEKFK